MRVKRRVVEMREWLSDTLKGRADLFSNASFLFFSMQ